MISLRRVHAAFPKGTRLFFENKGAETQENGGSGGDGEKPEQQARESGRERNEGIEHQPCRENGQADSGNEREQGRERFVTAGLGQERSAKQEARDHSDDDPGLGRTLSQAREHPARDNTTIKRRTEKKQEGPGSRTISPSCRESAAPSESKGAVRKREPAARELTASDSKKADRKKSRPTKRRAKIVGKKLLNLTAAASGGGSGGNDATLPLPSKIDNRAGRERWRRAADGGERSRLVFAKNHLYGNNLIINVEFGIIEANKGTSYHTNLSNE
jgi:hypothetical protein